MKLRFSNKWLLGLLLAPPLLTGGSLGGAVETEKEVRSPRHPFAVAPSEKPPPPPKDPPPSSPPFEGRPPAPPSAEAEDRDRHRRSHQHRRRGMERFDDMAVLDRLLAMPPEQLARVRQAVERIEAMTPEEREALRERLRDFREISPEKRREIREKWRSMTPEERREHVREMKERQWNEVLEEDPPAKEEDKDLPAHEKSDTSAPD